MYYAGKSNTHADALSRKSEEVKSQQEAIERYCTQVLLPVKKVDHKVLQDLGLDHVRRGLPGPAGETIEIEKTALAALEAEWGYDSLQLVDRILQDNRTSPDLQDLRQKAQEELRDDTWQLREKLLL